MKTQRPRRPLHVVACAVVTLLLTFTGALAQDNAGSKDKDTYNQLKAFSLAGGVVDVKGVVLKRDRAQITLDGAV